MSKTLGLCCICILLSLLFSLFFFQKINLLTADVGRHVKNGEIFLHSSEFGISKSDLLHTNLFSYTNPDFPFVNHHWGSGVIMYLIWAISGFKGLSLVYGLLLIFSLIIALQIVKDDIDLSSIFIVGLFLVPLISDRIEVRPEAISYLFLCLFVYFLYNWKIGKISSKFLFLLPFFELIWVNTHIYFIFGPFLVAVFLFESLLHKKYPDAKKISIILILTSIATLISPYGITGALYPFTIFNNYGYLIVENQSVPFLEKLLFITPSFLWFKITSFLVIATSLIVLIKTRKGFPVALFIISGTFGVLTFLAIRNMTAFGLMSLPLLVYNFDFIKKSFFENKNKKVLVTIYCILLAGISVGTFTHFSPKLPWKRDFGLGLTDDSLNAAKFVTDNNIHGPIFNNYNVGGAMIFSFFPKEKVFVDNRPEAYPKNFFNDTYIPMQQDESVWKTMNEKYNFNAIYFQWQDLTPWTQAFLIARVDDPLWAPVYADNQVLIFLKTNPENKNLIDKYKIPRSVFSLK